VEIIQKAVTFPGNERALCFFAQNGFHKVSTAARISKSSANHSGKTYLAAKTETFRIRASELLRSK
jgi:hypothetical protein